MGSPETDQASMYIKYTSPLSLSAKVTTMVFKTIMFSNFLE